MSSCTHQKYWSICETNMCVLRHIISTSFTAFLRLTPDSLQTVDCSNFEATRCSGTACKLFTQVALPTRQLRYGRVCLLRRALLLSPTSVSTINVTRSYKRLSQGVFWCIHHGQEFTENSTPSIFDGSIFDIKRRPPKPIRVDNWKTVNYSRRRSQTSSKVLPRLTSKKVRSTRFWSTSQNNT
jgi:hypothetical protein